VTGRANGQGKIMNKTNDSSRELTSNDLDAVSGGSLPLPLLATVIADSLPSLPPVKGPADGYVTPTSGGGGGFFWFHT
jgi:hypothetical protein